jgi:hypothetical protein
MGKNSVAVATKSIPQGRNDIVELLVVCKNSKTSMF